MGDTPKRIQLSRRKGSRMPPNTKKVDRSTDWGNPYWTASEFRPFAERMAKVHPDWLDHLRGKNLACWCHLCDRHAAGRPLTETCPECDPCHVDVYGELLYVARPQDKDEGHG